MLSDCEKCWSTPCQCGWDYKDYGVTYMSKFMFNIMDYYTDEQKLQIIKEVEEKIKDKKYVESK